METLEIVNILEEKDFSHHQAIRLAEAINGKSGLATKEDIAEVKTEIAQVRSDIKWIIGLMIAGFGSVISGIIGILNSYVI